MRYKESDMPAKIPMKQAVAELDGDEMTRVIWALIKEKLILPYVDLKAEYYDLGLEYRNQTDDQVTVDSANAIKRLGVGIKCATITPNADRMKEYTLKKMWVSPNGTIRSILDGTVFRSPILLKNVKSSVPGWTKPICLGRHAYGDVYANSEILVPGPGKAEIVFTGKDGTEIRQTIKEMNGPGVIQGMHNLDGSIESFARACFLQGLNMKYDVWFATKDTISKVYDRRFKDIFAKVYAAEFEAKFKEAGLSYYYMLIDDAVAKVMKSSGGFLWACKNYDGDVMSDMVASAFGSLGMMTSVLVSPSGVYEYEAAHGTVQQHYYKWKRGEKTSTNPVASIYAWTGGLRQRGIFDGNKDLIGFADALDKVCIDTIESGLMTGDLARIADPAAVTVLDSMEFMDTLAANLKKALA
jgi:isocitrate dehydrogenase